MAVKLTLFNIVIPFFSVPLEIMSCRVRAGWQIGVKVRIIFRIKKLKKYKKVAPIKPIGATIPIYCG